MNYIFFYMSQFIWIDTFLPKYKHYFIYKSLDFCLHNFFTVCCPDLCMSITSLLTLFVTYPRSETPFLLFDNITVFGNIMMINASNGCSSIGWIAWMGCGSTQPNLFFLDLSMGF